MMRKIRLNEWQTNEKRIWKLVFWLQKQKGERIDWFKNKRSKEHAILPRQSIRDVVCTLSNSAPPLLEVGCRCC